MTNAWNRFVVTRFATSPTILSACLLVSACFGSAPTFVSTGEGSNETDGDENGEGPAATSAPSTGSTSGDSAGDAPGADDTSGGDDTTLGDTSHGDTTLGDTSGPGATDTDTGVDSGPADDTGDSATDTGESDTDTGDPPVVPCRVERVEPFAARIGDTVTLHGSGFVGQTPRVTFSGVLGEVTSWNATTIEVQVPSQAGSTIQASNDSGPCNEYVHQIWDIHTWDSWAPPGAEHGTTRTQGIAVDDHDVPRIVVNDGGGNTSYLGSTYDPSSDRWPDLVPVLSGNNHANYNTSSMTMVAGSGSRLHMAWRSGGGRVNHLSVEAPNAWAQDQTTAVFIPPGQGIGVHIATHPVTGTVLIGHTAGNHTDGFIPYYLTSSMPAFTDSSAPGTQIGSGLDSGNVRVAYPPGAFPLFLTVDRLSPYTIRLHTLHDSQSFTVPYFSGGVHDTGLAAAAYLRPIELVSDSANRPMIAYMPATGRIAFARFTSTLPFAETPITDEAADVLDFEADRDNNLYLVYGTTGGQLRLSRYDSDAGQWDDMLLARLDVGGQFSRGISMTLDSRHRLHVVYLQRMTVDGTVQLTARVLYTRP